MGMESKNESVHQVEINRVLKSIFISLLIDLFGFTIILPLFPSLLDYYKLNDEGTLYSSMESCVDSFKNYINAPESANINSVLYGGVLGSLFSFLQFMNSPIFGAASDVYGRRPLIVLSLMGTALSYIMWAVSKSFLLFIVARVIGGISEANVSISTAMVADLKTPEGKSKGMATIGVAFSIAFVVGPLLGAIFSTYFRDGEDFSRTPALFSLAIVAIDIIYVLRCLPETLPPEKRASSIVTSLRDVIHLINPVSLFRFSAVKSTEDSFVGGRLRRLGLVYFLYLFLFSGLEFTLTFLAHSRFHFTHLDQGKMFAFLGVLMALVQGGYVRRQCKGKEKKLALQGMFVLIFGFIIIGFCSSVAMLYFGLVFFAFAAASIVPSLSALTAAHGLYSEKGRIVGILRSLGALARATGPICASASFWLYGSTFTYVFGGILLVFPMLLLSQLQELKVEKDD